MNINNYKDFLLSHITRAKLVSGGREIQCRCLECPDSRDIRNQGHMYISIPQNDNEPSLYHCFKCNCAGVVTHQKLLEWNIFDDNIATELITHNSKCAVNKNNDKYFNRITYKVFSTLTTDNEISNIKLNYINNRLGTNFTYDQLRRLKIILNLNDILKENNISELTRDKNIVDQLSINFVGFLSIDNAFLCMRRIVDEGLVYKSIDKRYINYKIFNKFDSSERFYVIPTSIDILSNKPIKINIAEGPFDILSIYWNIRNKEEGIYAASTGCNYFGMIMYLLETFKLINIEIHIYADNDNSGNNNKMNYIASKLAPLNIPLYVHRNIFEKEKDFGVRPENINESIIKLI